MDQAEDQFDDVYIEAPVPTQPLEGFIAPPVSHVAMAKMVSLIDDQNRLERFQRLFPPHFEGGVAEDA